MLPTMRTNRATKAAVVAVAVVASTVVAYLIQHQPAGKHMSAAPATVVSVPATPAAVATPAPHAPTRSALRHDRVAPAAPTAFEIRGSAFDIKAGVCPMDYVRPLDPPGDQVHTVCWVRANFGVAPGSKSGGTSYILGHAWAQAKLVFNPLSELATSELDTDHPQPQNGVPTYPMKGLNGYRVTLRTRNGTLTYVVRHTFAVSKEHAGDVHSLMANTPNRVVLITCAVAGGADLDYNIVVYANLISSVAAHRPAP